MAAFSLNPTALTSELEAVNAIIGTIGELPVDDLSEAEFNADVQLAIMFLRKVQRDVQVTGWTFNSDTAEEWTPDPVTKEIALPSNVVRVKLSDHHWGGDRATERARKLYDLNRRTFEWEYPVRVDTVRLMPFADLPEAVRMYVVIKAGRMFQSKFVGSQALHAFTEVEEMEAYALLQDFEVDTANANFLTDSADVLGGWAFR